MSATDTQPPRAVSDGEKWPREKLQILTASYARYLLTQVDLSPVPWSISSDTDVFTGAPTIEIVSRDEDFVAVTADGAISPDACLIAEAPSLAHTVVALHEGIARAIGHAERGATLADVVACLGALIEVRP